jgi:hypothetical protein
VCKRTFNNHTNFAELLSVLSAVITDRSDLAAELSGIQFGDTHSSRFLIEQSGVLSFDSTQTNLSNIIANVPTYNNNLLEVQQLEIRWSGDSSVSNVSIVRRIGL